MGRGTGSRKMRQRKAQHKKKVRINNAARELGIEPTPGPKQRHVPCSCAQLHKMNTEARKRPAKTEETYVNGSWTCGYCKAVNREDDERCFTCDNMRPYW